MALKNRFRLLSIELIEHILLQLTRPSDLLSLALTEQSLCSIIIPHFLDYCRLVFPIERTDVWEHLNEHPLFCSRVRHLELCFRHHFRSPPQVSFNTIVPRSLRNVEEISSGTHNINGMCSVLAKMSNLKRIAFYNNHGGGKYMTPSEIFPLALAVYNSGCKLESIEVDIYMSNLTKETSEELELSFFKILSDENWLFSIKKISFSFLKRPPRPSLNKNFQTALFSMVNLTHLQLIGCPALFTDATCYWPNLEFLYFTKAEPSANEDFDVEFVSRHPRLRTLYLENATLIWRSSVTTDIPDENIVPTLRSLSYTGNIFINGSLNYLSWPVIRNLTHLTLGAMELSIFEGLEALESCIIDNPPATSSEEVIQVITSVSRGCKNLKKLAFWTIYPVPFNTEHDVIFSLFQDLPNLTHLFGVFSWNGKFLDLECDTLLKKLYQFPKLQYIDCYRDSRPNVSYVKLRRNDILRQMECEILEYTPESCDCHQWGGGFSIPT